MTKFSEMVSADEPERRNVPADEPERIASSRPRLHQQKGLGGDSKAWECVVQALRRHYHNPDLEAARVLYAAVAAHDLKGQPVWPMAVAPPGSMKTELIRALDGLSRVHSIDSVTSKSFISGQIRTDIDPALAARPSSLLHRIGTDGIILCADFSTVLSLKADDRNSVLADLRRIYDGELRKEFGTAEPVAAWKGRLTLVVAVTEEIDKYHNVIQSLGDRFVMIRWARADQEAALRAMTQDIEQARHDLKTAVHALFESLPDGDPTIPRDIQKRIAALAELAVRARSHVPREGPDKAVIGEPHPESPTRLAQQLAQLVKGSTGLAHRKDVNPQDFALARRAAFDCIPARRRTMLDVLIYGKEPIVINSSTKGYDREDLQVLGLVEGKGLSKLALKLLEDIDGSESDFTKDPPNANEEIDREVGENSRELADGSQGGRS
jgi:hypothetical protein